MAGEREGPVPLDVSYLHIEGLNGDTYKVTTGFDRTQTRLQSSPPGAGAAFDALDASLNITWVL